MAERFRARALGCCLTVGLLAGLSPLPGVGAEELPFTHLTPDGTTPLPSGSVQKVLQDRLGFLWLAFYSSGVARYDGHALDPYTLEDGLPDVTVRELVEDVQGHLWVGAEAGLVVSTRPLGAYAPTERARFTARVGEVAIAPRRTRRNCLVADRDGWVWQGTGGEGLQLYRLRDGKLESRVLSTDVFDSGRNEPVTAMTVRRDGSVWAALGNGVWLRFGRDGTRTLLDPQELGGSRRAVSAVTEGPSGTLWVGYLDGGVGRLDPRRRPALEDLRSPLKERISALLESSTGELWAASLGHGLARFPLKGERAPDHYRPEHGLLSDSFWHLLEDREGALWLAQNGGLSRLASDFPAIGRYTRNTLADPGVFAVVPPYRGEPGGGVRLPSAPVSCPAPPGGPAEPPLWLGTGGGLVALCGGRVEAVLGLGEGLASASIYALGADRQGRLWIGTAQGLNCLTFDGHTRPPALAVNGRSVTLLGQPATVSTLPTTPAPIYSARSHLLPADGQGRGPVESLWFAGTGGLWALVGDAWFFFEGGAGVPAAGTTGVEVDAAGRVWVGTADRGLLRSRQPLTAAALQRLAAQSQAAEEVSLSELVSRAIGEISAPVFEPVWDVARGAPSNSIRNLLRVGTRMLVGTPAGLAVLDVGAQRLVALHDGRSGLGGDAIVGMAVSPATGRLWVSQNAGLAELDEGLARVRRWVTRADGLADDEAWAYGSVAVGADGVVYFGSPRGLSLVRPARMRETSPPPQLRWTRVTPRQDEAGHFEVTFGYSALALDKPQAVRYRSRLLGYNPTWSAPTRETRLRFTNLEPGEYTFEVDGTNGAGYWSQAPLRYTFTVPPRPARTARPTP